MIIFLKGLSNNEQLNDVCMTMNWCKQLPLEINNNLIFENNSKSSHQNLLNINNTRSDSELNLNKSVERDRKFDQCYLLKFNTPLNRVIIE